MKYVLIPLELLERAKAEIVDGYIDCPEYDVDDLRIIREIDHFIDTSTAVSEFRH